MAWTNPHLFRGPIKCWKFVIICLQTLLAFPSMQKFLSIRRCYHPMEWKMCVLWKFEIAIGAMGKVPTFIEIHWKMLVLWKFGSEITCCLRPPLMERTFDMKSQERLLHTTAKEFSKMLKCHHILHFIFASTDSLVSCKPCFPLFVKFTQFNLYSF